MSYSAMRARVARAPACSLMVLGSRTSAQGCVYVPL